MNTLFPLATTAVERMQLRVGSGRGLVCRRVCSHRPCAAPLLSSMCPGPVQQRCSYPPQGRAASKLCYMLLHCVTHPGCCSPGPRARLCSAFGTVSLLRESEQLVRSPLTFTRALRWRRSLRIQPLSKALMEAGCRTGRR